MINAISHMPSYATGPALQAEKPGDLVQAAEQFEAMFLRTLLQQMRQSSQSIGSDNLFDSKQQNMLRELYDDKLASHLAAQRSAGIAQMILSQLSPADGQALNPPDPAAALTQQETDLSDLF